MQNCLDLNIIHLSTTKFLVEYLEHFNSRKLRLGQWISYSFFFRSPYFIRSFIRSFFIISVLYCTVLYIVTSLMDLWLIDRLLLSENATSVAVVTVQIDL